MIVDGNADELQLSEQLVQSTGLGVAVVAGTEVGAVLNYLVQLINGIQEGEEQAPSAIFLEIEIPGLQGLGGLDVLRWIRSRPSLASARIFILSSSRNPDDIARARDLGAAGYLFKHPPLELMRKLLLGGSPAGLWPGQP